GTVGAKDQDLRRALLKFIGDFANWDVASHPVYLEVGRGLVKAAHTEETPLVVDPFAGGGSIPLEALRLGCEAFASDLNPVACLILKVMLEDIPRHACLSADRGRSLAEELRRVGAEIKKQAEKELAEFYPCLPAGRPKDPDGATPGKFHVYILRCSDGSLYKGHTDNLSRRFKQHCKGEVEWTKDHLPVDLIHYEEFDTREKAVEREQWLKSGVGREWLAKKFPKEQPIAYLWARTVKCESPNCGAEIPLVRSFWLCKKANRKRALRYKVHHRGTESTENKKDSSPCPLCLRGEFPHVEFEIFEPKTEKEVPDGTVTRARATCLACGTVLPAERVRAQLAAQRGGADVIFNHRDTESTEKDKRKYSVSSVSPWCRIGGARLLAVVTLKPGEQGRHYHLPTEQDYQAVWKAQKKLKAILDEWERGGKKGLCPVPDEPLPPIGTLGFRVQRYGMIQWGDLFTARQKVALVHLTDILIANYEEKLAAFLAMSISKIAMQGSTSCRWKSSGESLMDMFGRHALPIVWDFAEAGVFSGSTGDFNVAIEWLATVISMNAWLKVAAGKGQVEQLDARESTIPAESCCVFFTDPPYYDAIPYSDLSDFFFVWLKRALPMHSLLRDPFDANNKLTPKIREAVQDETREFNRRPKDRIYFEETMAKSFFSVRQVLKVYGIGSVIFAHKTTEGWEALISGLVQGGLTITGSWPIATEMSSRLRARDSAALATSVHLVCRPRPENAPVGDWADVLRELPNRVGDWMERLQNEGIRGADLVFACIGPALEIFSRYSRVETAEGREVKLDEYLMKVWEVVGLTALEQVLGTEEARARNGLAGALEEDARLTALFLWTLQSTNGQTANEANREAEAGEAEEAASQPKTKGYCLIFDIVRRFAQPLGIHLPDWEGRIIETRKGVVRLLSVSERAKQLFGEEGAESVADWIEHDPHKDLQQLLFPEMEQERVPKIRGRRRRVAIDLTAVEGDAMREATTLDRIHAAMLLQAVGQANALRALIKAEQERGDSFLRLANALSALYPTGSEEKRLLDAMLLAVPR
ncbi:MAG: GIY-YIG nuclease family protein, partial [Deltaproteobacteria bacterium]|nr:GIY-YIG nuclease family protein [Deltaproteobacteria bacterium]